MHELGILKPVFRKRGVRIIYARYIDEVPMKTAKRKSLNR
jgi:hypothetical protein